ncbi:hypothetical protein AAG570_006201 [Ranatra chinensis]|uniref:Amidase domain-containing protein n=1 Tax=Ranatra chinensis TaxID=642074 RepID=A0ABD0XXC3_9HEMI
MEEARRVDRTIRDGDHPPEYWESEKPLFGIPVTIKESLAVKGMPGGWLESVGLDRKAAEDAEAVANLRASGAVPILVSATPQLCLFLETFNSVQGTSCNPFDSSRTPGGSSGGEGALVGSAASLAGLGTDIIGSIRVPAFFCGVFGHKPSPGIISVKGHRPTCRDEDWDKYLTAGPLCRYAEDLPLILKAVAPKATQILKLDQPVDIRKIRVFFMEEDDGPMTHRVDEEIKISIRKAVEHLSKVCEVQPQEIKFREFHDTLEAVFTLMLRMKSPTNIFQKSSDPEVITICLAIQPAEAGYTISFYFQKTFGKQIL